MLVEVLPALLLATAVHVEGNSTCPRPEQVTARLGELLARPEDTAAEQAADRARLSEDGAELVVALERPGGELLGTRRFSRSAACDDLAAAVAVSLAVWLSDVHPAYSTAQLAPLARLPTPTADLQVAAPPPPPRAGAAWGAGLALGLGSALDTPATVADGMATGWLRLGDSRNALRAEAEVLSRRELTLPGGKGEWRRWILGLGLERALSAGAGGLDRGWLRGFATARLAWLDLDGVGFAVNHSSRVLDPGASAGLRAVWKRGRWASWVEVALSLWPIRHDAVVASASPEAEALPVLDAFLRVGAGWGAAH